MPATPDEIRRAFRDRIEALSCPHCNAAYTGRAADWCEAWLEGRRDAMRERDAHERDGAIKLQCEKCGGQAMTNAFFSAPRPI